MKTLKAAFRIHKAKAIMVNITHWPEYCKYFPVDGIPITARSECVKVPEKYLRKNANNFERAHQHLSFDLLMTSSFNKAWNAKSQCLANSDC